MTVRRILAKHRQQVTLKAGVGGNNRSTVMKDYVQLYIEFLLMIDPKLYLSKIRDYPERDLRLNVPDLPSIMTIQRFIAQRGFTRKKCTRVAIKRVRPENVLRKKAFTEWRKTVDSRQLFFVDETGFEDFARRYGRSPSNYPLPSFARKVKPDKTSGDSRINGVLHWSTPWSTFGALLEYFWSTFGALLEYFWNTIGALLE